MKDRSLKLTTRPQYVCAVMGNEWTFAFKCSIRLHALMLTSRVFRDALVIYICFVLYFHSFMFLHLMRNFIRYIFLLLVVV
jgi:hypothetical protein